MNSAAPLLDVHQYLIFSLGGERFGMDILQVREIIGVGRLTEVPMAPPAVRGVINLRGAVVPVIDLSARFGRGQTSIGPRTCIVIAELPDGEASLSVGVMVDGVSEVLELAAADIEPPPGFGTRLRADFVSGMGRMGEGFVIILDPAQALSLDELAELVELDAA